MVELVDGRIVEVWVTGSHARATTTRSVLSSTSTTARSWPADARVLGETPPNPSRFTLAVARFPKAAARLPEGDEEWPAVYNR
jgi:hypothetical protein